MSGVCFLIIVYGFQIPKLQRKKAQKNKPTPKGRLKTLFKFAPII